MSVDAERRQPRLLDLFCGAGGAAAGYHRAGFNVVGVDINPQPRYPFRFIQGDALNVMERLLGGSIVGGYALADFDSIAASPVCYRWSKMRDCRPGSKADQPDLITPLRPLLIAAGMPYVMENVPGAPLLNPVRLCGSGLGLRLQRHREFEASFPLWGIPCAHGQNPWNPAYGHATGRKRRRVPVIGEWRIPEPLQQAAMGIDWMTLAELQEAIPPAYTEYIGCALLDHLAERAA
jgi:DNA (cytosine-5)-methyltransferase 1